jgi:hypothetical protein
MNFANIDRLFTVRTAEKLTVEEREEFDGILLGYIVNDVDSKLLNKGIAAALEHVKNQRERRRGVN